MTYYLVELETPLFCFIRSICPTHAAAEVVLGRRLTASIGARKHICYAIGHSEATFRLGQRIRRSEVLRAA